MMSGRGMMDLLNSSVIGGSTPYLEALGLVVVWVDSPAGG